MSGPSEEPAGRAQLLAEIKALRHRLARERVLLLIVMTIALVAVAARLPGRW